MGLVEEEERRPKVAAPLPPPLVLLGLGEVAGPLLLFSPPRNPSWTRIGGGILLPEGVGLSCASPPWPARPPSSPPFYTEAGAPLNTQVDTS